MTNRIQQERGEDVENIDSVTVELGPNFCYENEEMSQPERDILL